MTEQIPTPLRPAPRRPAREVRIGDLRIGAGHPILIQSMTISDTLDTEAVVREIRDLAEAGCPLVRLTAPSLKAAENLGRIRERMNRDRIRIPLAADIHFLPQAAMVAAGFVEKVRINPGNFAELRRPGVAGRTEPQSGTNLHESRGDGLDPEPRAQPRTEDARVVQGTDAEALERIAARLLPLVEKLKQRDVALRIGVNHGSLSERLLSRYGDTPEGMVESALEYVRLCRSVDYHQIVLSMKSSIPSVTIAAYRLLVQRMDEESMDYPLHLGVTEAGDGLDGRVKSTVGIGSLLADGIGDTIRVSLTEDSRHEIPAAEALLRAVERERGEPADISGPGLADPVSSPGADEPMSSPCATKPHAHKDVAGAVPWHPRRTNLPSAQGRRRIARPLSLGRVQVGGPSPVRVELRLELLPDGSLVPDVGIQSRDENSTPTGHPDAATLPTPGRHLTSDRHLTPGRHLAPGRHDQSGQQPASDLRPELISVRPDPNLPPAAILDGLDRAREAFSAEVPAHPVFPEQSTRPALLLEWRYSSQREIHLLEAALPLVDGLSLTPFQDSPGPGELHGERFALLGRLLRRHRKPVRWRLPAGLADPGQVVEFLQAKFLRQDWPEFGFLCEPGPAWIPRVRALAAILGDGGAPLFLETPARGPDPALLAGSVLTDGLGDSLCLARPGEPWPPGPRPWDEDPVEGAYRVLQACRLRMTRAEIIACPSCGRTQFDLQTVTARVRERVGHLRGVKIAVMGCIVNGPGEMADADFGYVGSGQGEVDLYVNRERVQRNIPEEEAPDRLVELIRSHGRWIDPPSAGL